MRVFFLVALGALLVPLVSLGQTEKPEAALAPVSALGEISQISQMVVLNSLRANLSKSYKLTSELAYQEAEEQALKAVNALGGKRARRSSAFGKSRNCFRWNGFSRFRCCGRVRLRNSA